MDLGAGGIKLEIVTQKGLVLSEQVEEVIAPSVGGEFGVLPGHLPLLAALGVGLVHYRQDGKLVDVAVANGFVEVADDHAVILTDRFARREDVDVLSVRERLEAVDEELDTWSGEISDPRRIALVEEEQWLAIELELIGDPPVAHLLESARVVDYSRLFEHEAGQAPALEPDETEPEGDEAPN